ncbi:phosphatase PAP2 family protein [Novosphingobium sp. Gsoil 351]|uniref:phosphatase PAP2 family protein n=1 Tax=Novosphingobium sp. Gsoil 351 TaxID=2675225 RepID=UPI0012B44428|nr:phosphatase PAP2 family protein [Novosphingobium sp. Gsoil 351]QGN53793.1 phosphatase PAP2 family protein [Novosphingobium sp. Gsoil 351]
MDPKSQATAGLPAETVTLPARGWRIDPTHALLAGALCWIGFAVVVVAVLSGNSADFDAAGLRLWRTGMDFHPRGAPWLAEAVRDYTALGGVLLRNLVAMGALVALLFLRLRREATLLALTIATGWAVNSAIKAFVGRPRPAIVSHLTDAGGLSFPSGHSFNSAVVYISIALAFAALSPRHSVRATVVLAAMALTFLIALSRVWLGVHYPSDAIAGWLGGAGWAFIASALLYRPAKAAADSAVAEGLDPTSELSG